MDMTEEKQEGQKTIVAFIAGLLIGGLLVWVFSDTPEAQAPENGTGDTVEETENGEETGNGTNENGGDSGDANGGDNTTENGDETPTMSVGDGAVDVSDQEAGRFINLDSVTFPTDEGWIGVRSYANGQLGSLLGVVRYSKEQGLIPETIELQVPTTAGREYAVVFYTESGDREFSLAEDVQIDEVFATFTAQ